MDDWAWEQLSPGSMSVSPLLVGPLFCVVTAHVRAAVGGGRRRSELRRVAREACVRRGSRHQLRHAHTVEMAREGVPLIVIQRQLGHTNLGITSIYLEGIDSTEIIDTVHARRAPMVPFTLATRLIAADRQRGDGVPLPVLVHSTASGRTNRAPRRLLCREQQSTLRCCASSVAIARPRGPSQLLGRVSVS